MDIRGARQEDVGAMVALARQSPAAAHWAKSFYSGLFEEKATVRISLVAEDAGAVRGFLIARVAGDECELENIVVAEAGQRQGLGSQLIRALIDAVRGQKAKGIFLEVRESNAAARSCYHACGFSITGRRESYYSDPAEAAVLYTLAL
jgi:ribosomal-protein-alanine N-acetyltransferase